MLKGIPFVVSLLILGCGGKPDRMSVYRQLVPGSASVIYYVDAYYDGIGGRFFSDFVISDSTEQFRYSRSQVMPFTDLLSISQSSARVATFSEPHLRVLSDTVSMAFIQPVRQEKRQFSDLNVENTVYRTRTGTSPSCGLRRYRFDQFEETQDSLFIKGLRRDIGPEVVHLAFPKGAIKAKLDADDYVQELTIKELVNGFHSGYRTASPFELVMRPTLCFAIYELIHEGAMKKQISDYGVFKLMHTCIGDC